MLPFIFAIMFFCLGILFLTISSIGKDRDWAIFLTILFFGLPTIIVVSKYEDEPKAIHVYQGKTTLEITYRDNIPVDSVVIFKTK